MKTNNTERTKTTTKTPQTTPSLGEFLTTIANDDVLLEVFTRLRSSRTICHCAAVCMRWRSVISQPDFVPTLERYRRHSLRYTVLFTHGHGPHSEYPIFSKDSNILHRISDDAYFNFLPADYTVAAACKDLLLVKLSPPLRCLCICNPLTRRWTTLPKAPGFTSPDPLRYMFVSGPGSGSGRSHYRVAAIMDEPMALRVAVFRSETGRWDPSLRTLPVERQRFWHWIMAGTSDGIIYRPLVNTRGHVTKIIAIDPFALSGLGFREVNLPAGFKRGWWGRGNHVCLGAVGGRLRLLQYYVDYINKNTSDELILKVWQLNTDNGCDEWDNLHDLIMKKEGDFQFCMSGFVITLHPDDDDVFFLVTSLILLRRIKIMHYRVSTQKYRDIGTHDIGDYSGLTSVFNLEHQPWPTEIPQLLRLV